MAKSKTETFLLSKYFDREMILSDIFDLKHEYNVLIESTKLVLPEIDTLGLMLWAKRQEISFGPYRGLSFFEISNRIYSDLILIHTAELLFTKYQIKSIRLNLSNKGGNDMHITDKDGMQLIGEAFNTACSFFQIKLRSDLKKFDTNQKGYIAFNKSALNIQNEIFLNTKKKKYPEIEFLSCEI